MNLETFTVHNLGVHEAAKEKLKQAESKFKDDPEMLDLYRITVGDWREQNVR